MKEDEENCPASRTPCRFMIFFTIIAFARIFLDIFIAISERNRNFVRKKPIKRKFMKKFFLFTLILLLPMVASAYDAYINGVYYNFSGTEAEVTSLDPEGNANSYSGVVEIPKFVTHDGTTYSVTSIGDYAFWGCSKLTSITIPQGVTRIGDFAFTSCAGLTSISIPEGVKIIGNSAFIFCTSLTNIAIHKGVTSIGEKAFSGCSKLQSVTIPEDVTSIGKEAFFGCLNLNSISIPKSVACIGEKAFSGCISLGYIHVEKGNVTYDSRKGCNAIIETATNTLIAGCEKTNIPKSVTSIGQAAFYGYRGVTYTYTIVNRRKPLETAGKGSIRVGLNSVKIPKNVTSIGDYAFWGCDFLKTVIIPKGLTSIGAHAFQGCSSLRFINIPNSVTFIGEDAFSGCKKLTSLKIPEGVTYVSNEDNFENDRIYETVDEIAQYPGGEAEGYKWLNGQIQYPADCLEQGVQGRVLVSLVIGKDGSIEEAKTVRSPHPSLSQEAERVFRMMPKWNPATQEGKPVRSRLIMPIMFKLKATDPDTIDKPHDPDEISTLNQ